MCRPSVRWVTWETPDFGYGASRPALVVGNTVRGPVRWVRSGHCERVVERGNDWSAAEPTEGLWRNKP